MSEKQSSFDSHCMSWSNYGPISSFKLSTPQDRPGGVIQLKGNNGVGKSTVIETIEILTTDLKPDLRPRDGTSLGLFEGSGVVIRLHPSKATRKGELDAQILNGQPLARFISGDNRKGVKERGQARCNALAAMVNLGLTDNALGMITGGEDEFVAAVPRDFNLLQASDLIRGLANKKALELETRAEALGTEAGGKLLEAQEILAQLNADLEDYRQGLILHDVEGEALEQQMRVYGAVRLLVVARTEHEAATRLAERLQVACEARATLESRQEKIRLIHGEEPNFSHLETDLTEIDAAIPHLSSQITDLTGRRREMEDRRTGIDKRLSDSSQRIEVLRVQLMEAERSHDVLVREDLEFKEQEGAADFSALATIPGELAEKRARRGVVVGEIARLRQEKADWADRDGILKEPLNDTTSDKVYEADLVVERAGRILERARLHQDMERKNAEQSDAAGRAQEMTRAALHYRRLGQIVIPAVVNDHLAQLGLPGLDMRDGVLWGEHPTRGMLPLDELSPGQIVRLGLAVELRGRPDDQVAILPFPQEDWDALIPPMQAIIHEESVLAKVWIITATARSWGELRAEEMVVDTDLLEIGRGLERQPEPVGALLREE